MSLNLPQAMYEDRLRQELEAAEREQRALLDAVAAMNAYKVRSYFHDCQPGCKPGSLARADHVPLPGRTLPTCRVLYGPHLAFFKAGRIHRERVFLAANRIGKSECASFEARCHLTHQYPPWWEGRVFDEPIHAWAAGDTRQTTRDIVQVALMGPFGDVEVGRWTGMIDPHRVLSVDRASGGVKNCLDTVYVQWGDEKVHGAPQVSELGFRSYDQGRVAFQGTARHLVWLDEETPLPSDIAESQAEGSSEIWTECVLRTLTTKGLVMATFTPLKGMTPFLKQYIETAVMLDTETGTEVEAKAKFLDAEAA